MSIELQTLLENSCEAIQHTTTLKALEQLRIQLLGKQGKLTELLKQVGQLDKAERPNAGQRLNQAKQKIQAALDAKRQILDSQWLDQQLNQNNIDVTLPGRGLSLGSRHPITRTQAQLEQLFGQAGFRLLTGPEVEDDAHNFTALNIPLHHPARALHDTFYLQNGLLLRTHTSSVEVRALKQYSLPLRIMSSGRVYRCDSDTTHTPMFHQLEGLVVDEKANFSELKSTLTQFLQAFFEDRKIVTRFRAAYFPFTEPSAEVDVQCVLCTGSGCNVCHHSGWLEILGCGMTHPYVLRGAGIDPEKYQGYAFGLGIDRLTLLRHRIPDLRLLFENDLRFLAQF